MEISDRIRRLLPTAYEVDAQNIEYFRTFDERKLPDSSRTPTEYTWLWGQPLCVESYFAAVDRQIYIPGQETVILNLTLEENTLSFGRAAYWRGGIWGFSVIGGVGPADHPIDWNRWSCTSFQGILTPADFACLLALDKTKHWIQLARGN